MRSMRAQCDVVPDSTRCMRRIEASMEARRCPSADGAGKWIETVQTIVQTRVGTSSACLIGGWWAPHPSESLQS